MCVDEVLKRDGIRQEWTQASAETYCECTISKMLSSGYNFEDFEQIKDQNSPLYNEMILPCLTMAYKTQDEFKSHNSYIPEDIKGEPSKSTVPLIDYLGKGYKLKITISDVSKYFFFDTGAADLIIDRETERVLLLNGALKKDSYLNKSNYTLANKQNLNGQLVKISNISIGDYTLNNVVIAVIDNSALLCGKNFLDKFKNWEIDEDKKVLILYK
jgi:predicted aspartyl protease